MHTINAFYVGKDDLLKKNFWGQYGGWGGGSGRTTVPLSICLFICVCTITGGWLLGWA